MASEFAVITNAYVDVSVTSNVGSLTSNRRFQKDLTVGALKGKLELLTGAVSVHMHLEVYDKDNKQICILSADNALLGSYPIDDGMRIHVIDKSGHAGEFEDLSKVQKYEMTADDYEKRTDSVKAFKEKMKLAQFKEVDPEEQRRKQEEIDRKEAEEKEKAASLHIGDRCEVAVSAQPTRRGAVMFVGEVSFKPGIWVGIKYDEPLGKNDGSVQGKRYFECPPKYGGFVKAAQVTVGDFPELGLEDDMDEL